VLAAELDDLRERDGRARRGDQVDHDLVLTQLGRDRHGGGLVDRRMLADDRLHLIRRDVLAAAADGLLLAV
jgi:hypothetical protein